ncbi:hypothetical protein [Nocardia puris]|uniref:Uncharacterized protein n=1 Tax=Nocardia puris TaxID=208602 RepID=A0A366DC75_9NOCA|nr:hypothetical protein [Nocardia puris]RBO87545.1 hypothetical protein DFR74_111252 [Nocardia puris]
MSQPTRPRVDPAMQAWIDEQKKHFRPDDLDAAVRAMRSIRRQRAQHESESAAA